MNHEEQHQELLLTDFCTRSSPIHCGRNTRSSDQGNKGAGDKGREKTHPIIFQQFEGGLREAGHAGEGFCFDNELPRHRTWLEPFGLADRLVTCREYAEFMADGGYRKPELWLSAGWDAVKANGWQAPLYWTGENRGWSIFTLCGEQPLKELETTPVSQVSYYEADAYARWAGRRLPTEFEWEAGPKTSQLRAICWNRRTSLRCPPPISSKTRTVRSATGTVGYGRAAPTLVIPAFARLMGPWESTTANS